MPCYNALTGYRGLGGKIVFNPAKAIFRHKPVTVACGQCIGCRLEYSRQWAVRCIHEASLHDSNIFVTLTYDNDNIPKDAGLNYRDFQLFMKRLRKRYKDVSFFACGEYGDKTNRPHYHAIIFNVDFKDKKYFKGKGFEKIYTSEELDCLWRKGFCCFGSVSFDSCAYVSRYVVKKLNEDNEKYVRYDSDTGEAFRVDREFAKMSRNPAIGKRWLDKNIDQLFDNDFCYIRNKKMLPPKYYDRKLQEFNLVKYREIKKNRVNKILKSDIDDEELLKRLDTIERVRYAALDALNEHRKL